MATNPTVSIGLLSGGAILAWLGIRDPEGGLPAVIGSVTARKPLPPKRVAEYAGGAITAGIGAGLALGSGALSPPIPGKSPAGVWGRYPSSGKPHPALDWPTPIGTPIHAVQGGRVSYAGSISGSFGTHVRIVSPNGETTIYGHLSKLGVRVGQSVSAGAVIGLSGSTGNSTGPHLHVEIRNAAGVPIDYTSRLSGSTPGITYR